MIIPAIIGAVIFNKADKKLKRSGTQPRLEMKLNAPKESAEYIKAFILLIRPSFARRKNKVKAGAIKDQSQKHDKIIMMPEKNTLLNGFMILT